MKDISESRKIKSREWIGEIGNLTCKLRIQTENESKIGKTLHRGPIDSYHPPKWAWNGKPNIPSASAPDNNYFDFKKKQEKEKSSWPDSN